jgi:hypothetical protein
MRNKPHPVSIDNNPQNRRYLMYRFHEDIIAQDPRQPSDLSFAEETRRAGDA